ncbi:MAG TPA: 3-isopropylmalate dehydrogenase [Verrucomicrobia bacterium]|nr:3-isopropylmalate dehydrogenase [Verrucomicrobiota bacterium]HOB31627.1 isocitrate/isopropylmalate family dehydrogenase [Verrucomicrobiota bacterium]HOP98726.1 isocitrate/isopropylmalate family dehydrogenase [Verrucomicrobiota bacterium]
MQQPLHARRWPVGALFLLGTGFSQPPPASDAEEPVIGLLPGNGIGPEIMAATLRVLAAVEHVTGRKFPLMTGGAIGEEAEAITGVGLPASTVAFCEQVFAKGGAILSGPGGGRYVYDLRRRFDLFCKFVPIKPAPELADAGRIVPAALKDVDILIVRDNRGGVYQGEWQNRFGAEGRIAEHRFWYTESQVYRIVEVAAKAAAHRRGKLHIVVKDGGVPGISGLWRDIGFALARKYSVRAIVLNVDLAAYELIQQPSQFDVIVAPNLFGDVLADVAGVLVGSRGLTFSGNYNSHGHAVYQTNHGCAHDLAGTDTANPAGQMLSLAMLLRESFGCHDAAALMIDALSETWRQGWRTADVAGPGTRVLGTQAMADQVVQEVLRLAEIHQRS